MNRKKSLTLAALCMAALATPTIAQQGGGMMAFVSEWDMNGDGVVTLDDFATRRGDQFEMFDLNGDGGIDAEEQANMAQTIAGMQEVNHGGQGHGQGQGQGQMGGQRGPGPRIHAAMTAAYADTDHDGVIARAEWEAATARLFADLDANGDGQMGPGDFGH
ncbi:MAG: hypothetical protein H6900_02330 [Rhodobacter sp.]|uniref:EF-hand domain-containing protein n=1 Tax=Pararhodobacter sp. TaxID=2127056 RepID=UPI002C5026F0|nr:EF-hand domain-containing protein [Pararhodobacter sp.]MCC0072105.1 hypothetical protein [Rhodobacter sp.]HPD93520.1 EF-hand domain-containing protein [Pararhodobacter sp.]